MKRGINFLAMILAISILALTACGAPTTNHDTGNTPSDGTTTTAEITETEYVYTATEDVEITITPVSGNNYFYSIVITY